MKIVYLDSHVLNPGDLSWAPLEALGDFAAYDRTPAADVAARAADADVLMVNKVRIGEAELAAMPRLKLICVSATGYDVVDVAAARRRGVAVCNCPGYSTNAVAQHVAALLLEVCNHAGHYAREVRNGLWTRSRDFCVWDEPLTELAGKRAAVVGFGNIGSRVAEILQAFGMQVFAVTSKAVGELPEGVGKLTLAEAFGSCDVVSLNCPLTAGNTRFVDESLLHACRSGLVLINTARGGLVDDGAVAAALADGRLGAYCADVLTAEPPAADNPLLSAPRAFLTPHIAWASAAARKRIIDIVCENIRAFMAGNPVNVVN